jgi:hypothetical protein
MCLELHRQRQNLFFAILNVLVSHFVTQLRLNFQTVFFVFFMGTFFNGAVYVSFLTLFCTSNS